MDNFDFSALIPVFQDALCPSEIGFTEDGYLSPCFTNTYLFAPIALILAFWGAFETKSLQTNGHKAMTKSGQIKFFLTCIYVVVTVLHGPHVFNAISLVASNVSLLIVFVLSFMDLKGVNVPQKPLEVYFFLAAALSGYLMVQFIGTKNFGSHVYSALYICLVASACGSARNIISAFDDAQVQAAKIPQKK